MSFFKSIIEELIDAGHTVDIACNEQLAPVPDFYSKLGCKQYHLDCTRRPIDAGNIRCIKQIRELVQENEYDIIHCHTPIAAACTRIACRNIRKQRCNTNKPLRVFYTAHGFHFYKGAPKKHWMVYYPVEWLCAHWTDIIITINHEDYDLAQNNFEGLGKSTISSGCKVEYITGVGIDLEKFANTVVDKVAKRREIGVPEDAFLLLSVGELSHRKNHSIVLKALGLLNDKGIVEDYNIHYVIAGIGDLKDELVAFASELGLSGRFHLLGQRSDCNELYKVSDLFIHPSFQEGLPVAVMEAMASGTPCAGSNIRGNEDLMPKEKLFDPSNAVQVATVIESMDNISFDANAMNEWSVEEIIKGMKKIYGL